MQRRALAADRGLQVRIVLALLLLLGVYAAIVGAALLLYVLVPQWWPYWFIVWFLLAGAVIAHYRAADTLVLRAARAVPVPRGTHPRVDAMLERLAALADVPVPELAVSPASAPNAFAVGLRRRNSVVAVTQGLLDRLDPLEVEAVLAHELAHIANRDAAALTAVSVPRTFGTMLVGSEYELTSYLWTIIWPLGIPLWAVGTLLTLTVSRYREFAADRGSALLTGSPQHLISALRKIAGETARIPNSDLRALAGAEAFFIVGIREQRLAIFADHPPLERRINVLEKIARELGRAA